MNDSHRHHLDQAPPRVWRSRFGIGWIVLAGIAGWFLWTEHRAHLFAYWPFAVLLACPLMHLFMHHGHHEHHGNHPPGRDDGAGSAAAQELPPALGGQS
jgi:hypothetical protein